MDARHVLYTCDLQLSVNPRAVFAGPRRARKNTHPQLFKCRDCFARNGKYHRQHKKYQTSSYRVRDSRCYLLYVCWAPLADDFKTLDNGIDVLLSHTKIWCCAARLLRTQTRAV